MKALRDAATLLILILLVASVRIGPVEESVELTPETETIEPMPALHLTTPATCPAAKERSEPAVTRTSTSPDLPANCRS